jgi:hypothetical protein
MIMHLLHGLQLCLNLLPILFKVAVLWSVHLQMSLYAKLKQLAVVSNCILLT